jgi:PAS domain S-box-containing protein
LAYLDRVGSRINQTLRHRPLQSGESADSARRFELAFRACPDPIVVTRRHDGKIIEANEAFDQSYGVASAKVAGRSTLELGIWAVPEERDRMLAIINAEGRVRDFECVVVIASGERRFGVLSAEPVEIDGESCMVVVFHDVTAQKLAEQSLRESEKRFHSLAEAAFEGIGITENGHVVDVNDQMTEMLRCRREDLIGNSVASFVAQESLAMVEEKIRAGEEGPYEHLAVRKDGTKFPVEVQARTFSSGRKQLRVTSIRDITARKEAEQALQRAKDDALTAHEQFTQRLISAQDLERKRLANELHDSLGQNLSLIKNRSFLALQSAGVPPATVNHVEAIAHLASDAVDEVRNLAQNLRPVHIDQFGLTDSLVRLLDQTAESTPLKIERRLESVDEVYRGEEATIIYRIVQEALNNVVRHSRAQHLRVSVERDLHCVRIRVEDDGCGFDMARVADARRVRTGIGLTSIAERVRMLGGGLEVDSAPAKGTRLQIELPLHPVDDGTERRETERDAG